MTVKQFDEENKGAFEAYEDGKKIGEMTYSKAGPDKIIVDHTEVDPAQKGQGVGKVLLNKLVEYAREQNVKVLPLCPFAASMFQKNVDIRDVLF